MNPIGLTEMVSRVFDERYRVERLIGVGRISAVYEARDLVANRRVALKVFDEALAGDEAFIDRLFEALEQAVVLEHPNIVEVIDWGIDGGPFVVTEFCAGSSLASMLDAGHRLDPSQALVMALECARALNHGHQHGAINASLNPGNILFTADQQARLSGYGLGKILADAPVAQSDRAIENVRYLSPEQARGQVVTKASDIYSLVLVLSEAVSGRPPEVSDTVVGTLMARADSPAVLAPELEKLAGPLERCGRVDPEQRPEAEELAIALLAAAESLPRPPPLPIVTLDVPQDVIDGGPVVTGGAAPDPATGAGPVAAPAMTTDFDADGSLGLAAQSDAVANQDATTGDSDLDDPNLNDPNLDDPDLNDPDLNNTVDVSFLGPLDDFASFGGDDDAIAGQVEVPGVELSLVPDLPSASAPAALEDLEQAEPAFVDVEQEGDDSIAAFDAPERTSSRHSGDVYEIAEDDADDRLPWWPLVVLAALIVAVVGAGFYVLSFAGSPETAQVPNLIGEQFDGVSEQLARNGWNVERLDTRVPGASIGSVVAQSPEPGSELDADETLTVTVSLGEAMVELPSDLAGLSVEQAEARLTAVGLQLGQVSEENSESLAAGLVVGVDEATSQKPVGETVAVRVSLGPEDRLVPPDLVGLSIGDAVGLLAGLRLQAVEESMFDPEVPAGTVLSAVPASGDVVPADSAVTLIVSAGPEPVEMPDLVDLALDEAIDEIRALGLEFVDTTGTPGEPVIGTLPPAGAIVDVGTEVTIILDDPDDEDDG